jgi:S1-C subfamily serine protease
MKLSHLLCVIFLVTVSIALAEAQTAKTTPPTKKVPASEEKHSSQQLPFAGARDMTVMIFWADPPTTPGGRPHAKPVPGGSGVWIGKTGYVATCYHVIANWTGPFKIGIARDPYITEGQLSVSITGTVNTFVAVLVASDPGADIAILKAETPPENIHPMPLVSGAPMGTLITPQHRVSPRGGTLKTKLPEQGNTVLLAGFPLSHDAEDTLILQTGMATGFFSLPQTQPTPPSSALRIMLSLVSNPGNSGGPVFDTDGKVVGLLEGNLLSPIRQPPNTPAICYSAKLNPDGSPVLDTEKNPVPDKAIWCQQNSGISFAVPAKLIADLAKRNNIDLQ